MSKHTAKSRIARNRLPLAIAASLVVSGTAATLLAAQTWASTPKTDCTKVKCIALTFDDGPSTHTSRLLTTLAKHEARATFFTVGQEVDRLPAIVAKEAEAGHEVGNHTYTHPDLTKLTSEKRKKELDRTDQSIKKASGSTPTLMRPPFGALNAEVRKESKYPLILWSIDTLDWKFRDSKRVAKVVTDEAKPGDIVLMHDLHATTVDAVPKILTNLEKKGFHFVTVSELFGDKKLKPGTVYSKNNDAFGRKSSTKRQSSEAKR